MPSEADGDFASVAGEGAGKTVLIVDNGVGLWGAQQVVMRLAPYLRRSGYRLILAAPDDDLAREWDSIGAKRVHIRRTTAPTMPFDSSLTRMASDVVFVGRAMVQAVRLAAIARREKVDLIVANSSGVHLEAVIAGRILRTPTIAVLHEQMPRQTIRSFVVLFASRSVAVSQAVHMDLPKAVRHSNAVIHNGVDISRYRPGDGRYFRRELSVSERDVLVGYIGRVDESKQVEHVVESVVRLREQGVGASLLIVGSASESVEYSDALRLDAESRLGDAVKFLGRVPDVTEILQAVDVVVFPGRMEGLSLGLLEALSTGKAVVAYRAAGVGEVIEDGSSGKIVEMGDVDRLTAVIGELCTDGEMRVRFGEAARNRIVGKFDAEIQARSYLDLIASVGP